MSEHNHGHGGPVAPITSGTVTTTLNVLVHGAVVFFVVRDTAGKPIGVRIFMADLGHEHSYKAGAWLAEDGLRKGFKYALTGVPPQTSPAGSLGGDRFQFKLNGTDVVPDIDPGILFCQFDLPWPMTISPLQKVQFKPTTVSTGVTPLVAGVTVFSYEIVSVDSLAIEATDSVGTGAFPWSKAAEPSGTINLHIFAENPVSHGSQVHAQHVKDAFNRTVAMIRNAQPVQMNNAPTGQLTAGTFPKDVDEGDVLDLARRGKCVSRAFLGSLKRFMGGSPPNGLSGLGDDACSGGGDAGPG